MAAAEFKRDLVIAHALLVKDGYPASFNIPWRNTPVDERTHLTESTLFPAKPHSIASMFLRIAVLSASSAAISAMISFGFRNAVSSALFGFFTERS